MRAATQSAISGTTNRLWPGWKDRPYPGNDGATTVKASRASPPKRAGSVRRGMISRNSNTEPGQPCSNNSGIGSGPTPGTLEIVQIDAVERDAELREGVQRGFLGPPVEIIAPVFHELAQIG